MPSKNKELISERNKEIVDYYNRFSRSNNPLEEILQIIAERKEGMITLYGKINKCYDANTVFMDVLSQLFYLSPRTIYGIVSGEYERRNEKENKSQ